MKLVFRLLGPFLGFPLDKIELIDILKDGKSFETHLNCGIDAFENFCLLWKCNLRKLVFRSLGPFIGFVLDTIQLIYILKDGISFKTHLNCGIDKF